MSGVELKGRTLILGALLAIGFPLTVLPAQANSQSHKKPTASQATTAAARGTSHVAAAHYVLRGAHLVRVSTAAGVKTRRYARGGGLSCVPFARNATGIEVAGNAWQWWGNAAGVYARGSAPERGSVLAFQSNGRMRLGHVAVVSDVINTREIEIDHANWWGPGMHGGVARNIPVVDVSENNDWSAVRVGLGESGNFGSIYPTYGFIYDRPDNGVMVANAAAPAPQQVLNPAPGDLRPASERADFDEVAEAPAPVARSIHHRPRAHHIVATNR